MSGTLREFLLSRAAGAPDGLAFADANRSVTYRELLQRASGQADRLTAGGVRAGDRVALVMNAGVSIAEALWATQLIGAVPCVFNPRVPPAILDRRTARIRPRLVVRDGDLDGAAPAAAAPPDPGTGPDDLAYLQLTSGTSGEPRAAMLTQRSVLAYFAGDDPELASSDDILVDWAPPWHDLGLVRFMLGGVVYGAPCHIVEPAVRTIPLLLQTISRVRATNTILVDFAYRLACRLVDPAGVDLSSLRSAGNGAEPVKLSTLEQFEQTFGLPGPMVAAYGLAEATLIACHHPHGEPYVVDARGNVGHGRPRRGLELRADGDLDAPGEILIRGEPVFSGYFEAPEDTAAALRDGWLHTGDVGYLDDGGRVYVLGRERAMIKRGGAIVAPRELEEVAQDIEGVRIAVAVGVPDRSGTTESAAIAVEHEAAGSDAAAAVAAAVSRAIAASHGFAPARVSVLPRRSIPRTDNGKLQHTRMRELLMQEISDAEVAAEAARA